MRDSFEDGDIRACCGIVARPSITVKRQMG